jgi:choline dehydrogenase
MGLLSVLAFSAGISLATCASTYDYIVVGSGPGGAPLAANLARAGYSTLLIEAGGDEADNPTYRDLANFIEACNDEATRWDFWVKHNDDPKVDMLFKHNTWDTGDGTFYVGLDPPPGAKVCLRSPYLEPQGLTFPLALGHPVPPCRRPGWLLPAQRRSVLAGPR